MVDAVSNAKTVTYVGGGFQQNNPKSYSGEITVKEAFVETVVPLLANLSWAKSLDFNGAVRRTEYSTSGSITTWKGGLTYVPFTGLLFRGTRSRDIRAATLLEQHVGAFTYGSVTSRNPADPLFNVVNGETWTTTQAGNPALKPEVADTLTVGTTWTPAELKGLAVSLDLYNIKIKKSVGTQSTQDTMDRCFGAGRFAGTAPDASQYALLNFSSQNYLQLYQNLGLASTRGVDLEVSYRFPLNSLIAAMPGTLTLRALANYLDEQNTTAINSLPVEISGSGPNPHLQLNVSSTYQNGPWTLYLQARYLDETRISNVNLAPTFYYPSNHFPSVTYVNASVQYTIFDKGAKGNLQVYGNVNNLFDRDPPLTLPGGPATIAGIGGSYTSAGAYDVIGRAFTMGLRFKY